MTNRRRILLGQLNCMLRLSGLPEVHRYRGTTATLGRLVARMYRSK